MKTKVLMLLQVFKLRGEGERDA